MKQSIKIPELRLTLGDEQCDLRWFIRWLNDNDARLNTDGKGIRASVRIETALAASEGASDLVLEADDRLLLYQAANDPHWLRPDGGIAKLYPATPARQFAPFIEALNAPRDLTE